MTSFIEGNVEINSKYPMLGFQILILFIYKYSPYRRYHVHKYKHLFNGSKQHGEESSQKAIKATLGRGLGMASLNSKGQSWYEP